MGVDDHGDCFETAAELQGQIPGSTLVHAAITGQGPIEGLIYVHAWVEAGGLVFDRSNGNNILMPVEEYRGLARLQFAVEYGRIEAAGEMLLTEHYGPWAPELEEIP